INAGRSPIIDELLQEYLDTKELDLHATTDPAEALGEAQWVIVATPTNYDEQTNYFDTSSVEKVLDQIDEQAPEATVVIKSTIPVGFTTKMRTQHPGLELIFSPEFLREGQALHDSLHPS